MPPNFFSLSSCRALQALFFCGTMPDKVNVLSPDGQDEVVDNYRNYIQQVVDGQITAEEAAQKTYDDAAALFTE